MSKIFVRFVPFMLIILLSGLTACNTTNTPYEVVKAAEITPGNPPPTPNQTPILTISGPMTHPNVNDTVVLDLATLEKLRLVKYTVNDPWENRRITYTGVLVSDLLEAIGPAANVTSLHFKALDDYEIDLPLTTARELPVLLATQADGQYMDIDHSGPTRLIFPFDSFSDAELINYRNLAIWSISELELR